MAITGYNDMIQNPEGYPNALQNLERFQDNRFTDDDEVPGMGKKAIDYIDGPVSFMMRANHPTKFDPATNLKNFVQEAPSNIKNTLGSFKNRIGEGITSILDNTIMGKIMAGFNPINRRSGNFNPMLEGQLDLATGEEDEGGLGWGVDDIGRFTSGPLAGQASMSGFGTNDVTQQLRNRLQKLRGYDYISDIKTKKEEDILDAIRAQTIAENAGYSGTPGGNTGSGAFAKIDNTGKTYGPYSGNQGNQGNSGSGGRLDGPSGFKAYGGRVGLRYGGLLSIL